MNSHEDQNDGMIHPSHNIAEFLRLIKDQEKSRRLYDAYKTWNSLYKMWLEIEPTVFYDIYHEKDVYQKVSKAFY